MLINCYSKNKGWLFTDLQNYFFEHNLKISERPLDNADVYLCIRTKEAYISPTIEKTIVQVHDCHEYDVEFYSKAKLIIFTHPVQHYLWEKKGFKGKFKIIPIGTRKSVSTVDMPPSKPTVGFFCKETNLNEKRSIFFKEIILETKKYINFDVLLIGDNLDKIKDIGTYEIKAAGPTDYSRIDVLCSTSISPAVPLSIYEALSAGKPVVTTPRWFTFSSCLIHQCLDKDQFIKKIIEVLQSRDYYHLNRNKFATAPFILENWIKENINACFQ